MWLHLCLRQTYNIVMLRFRCVGGKKAAQCLLYSFPASWIIDWQIGPWNCHETPSLHSWTCCNDTVRGMTERTDSTSRSGATAVLIVGQEMRLRCKLLLTTGPAKEHASPPLADVSQCSASDWDVMAPSLHWCRSGQCWLKGSSETGLIGATHLLLKCATVAHTYNSQIGSF